MRSPNSVRLLAAMPLIVAALVVSEGCYAERRSHWDRYETARRADARCARIADRIDRDRDKIRDIEPTGRHRDALRWYEDDLEDAYRDYDRCRYGA